MRLRHLAAPPLLLLRRLKGALEQPSPGLRILLLHDVAAGQMAALDRLVGHLADRGLLTDPIKAGAFLGGQEDIAGTKVLLTFDDGFASNLEAAETVLARHGAKALFFICPELMALAPQAQKAAIAANIFDGKKAAGTLALMDWPAVERLVQLGHDVGNHTASHRRLSRLDDSAIKAEIAQGAAAITDRLGRPADWFAYPFGDIDSVDARVIAAAARHHRFCRSGVRGHNGPGTSPLAVRADHLDLGDPWSFQQWVIAGGLDRRYADARSRLDNMVSPRP